MVRPLQGGPLGARARLAPLPPHFDGSSRCSSSRHMHFAPSFPPAGHGRGRGAADAGGGARAPRPRGPAGALARHPGLGRGGAGRDPQRQVRGCAHVQELACLVAAAHTLCSACSPAAMFPPPHTSLPPVSPSSDQAGAADLHHGAWAGRQRLPRPARRAAALAPKLRLQVWWERAGWLAGRLVAAQYMHTRSCWRAPFTAPTNNSASTATPPAHATPPRSGLNTLQMGISYEALQRCAGGGRGEDVGAGRERRGRRRARPATHTPAPCAASRPLQPAAASTHPLAPIRSRRPTTRAPPAPPGGWATRGTWPPCPAPWSRCACTPTPPR